MDWQRDVRRVLPFAVLVGLWSCTDSPTDVGPAAPLGNLSSTFFQSAPAPGFSAHHWRDSRESQMTVTRSIGAEGGVIEFRELGASIVFPKGALSETTTIEARAIGGSVVAFEFSPHDVTFDVPVQIRIDARMLAPGWSASFESGVELDEHNLRMVRRQLTKMIGVYYGQARGPGVAPLQTLPMYLEDGYVVIEVSHFCGYAVATG